MRAVKLDVDTLAGFTFWSKTARSLEITVDEFRNRVGRRLDWSSSHPEFRLHGPINAVREELR